MDALVDMAQRGRSLGVHLVLATQRPAGAVKDSIRTNTNLRVALRMAYESDSSYVVDIKDAAHIDPELTRRAAAFADHCLLAAGATDEILGPGPRELIAVAALCARGEVEIAAEHMIRAYEYGMTQRHVLDAICCVLPMTGMISGRWPTTRASRA